jgi:hypothetical protein
MWAAGIRADGLIRALTTAPVATLPEQSVYLSQSCALWTRHLHRARIGAFDMGGHVRPHGYR